jgi:hypothetical protein
MARCAYCGTTILFGAVRSGTDSYCNQECHQSGTLMRLADHLPAEVIEEQVARLHNGPCPHCGGSGPVDVHLSYRVWSALLITSWHSRTLLCCRSCALRAKLGDAVFSGLLGWWGFPWGLIMTPVQVTRNLMGLSRGPDPARPSPELRKRVRLIMGTRAAEALANPSTG